MTSTLSWVTTLVLLHSLSGVVAYTSPELNRRHMAGLWKCRISREIIRKPLEFRVKEFTVYPRKEKLRPLPKVSSSSAGSEEEWLFMLKEDGSFQRYSNAPEDDDDINKSWETYVEKSQLPEETVFREILQGTWDFVDGELKLAVDRNNERRKSDNPKAVKRQDTLLVGTVVATQSNGLEDNPALTEESSSTTATASSNNNNETSSSNHQHMDTHLSVPKGSVQLGKFMYPKKHPSFFEQPMFQPKSLSTRFSLFQVMGKLNTQQAKEERLPKFHASSFHNKRFFLSSHPMAERKPRGERRWSIKYNKFVYDAPKKANKKEEDPDRPMIPIRVMEVQMFPNNTFATVAGLGSSTILRGKYDVIGRDKDQLWMQIWRFGFGRSVSGSTYSEGITLSHDDAKTFWGDISYEDDESVKQDNTSDNEDGPRRIQVKGSVLLGSGLEPQPIARFIMKEAQDLLLDKDEDDDEDDEEESEDDTDWSNAFQ